MTQYRIGSRADDAWDGLVEPGRRASDARQVIVPRVEVPEGHYKWIEHEGRFVVAMADHSHQRLLVHFGAPFDRSVCGVFEVLATGDGRDVVFTAHVGRAEIGTEEVADRIETWLRTGADVVFVDAVT